MAGPNTSTSRTTRRRKVLAIASRGGHWVQLLRLRPAFKDSLVTFVTNDPESRSMVDADARFYVVPAATRKDKLSMLLLICQVFWILLRERPDVVVTTGAAPGYIAIRIGKWFGARTMWIESIANAEELSLSGQLASRHANVVLTQWSHLSKPGIVEYRGAVI